MPQGKPAGVRCVQLNADNSCALFGMPQRPLACRRLRPCPSMCGTHRDEAMAILQALEIATRPIAEMS